VFCWQFERLIFTKTICLAGGFIPADYNKNSFYEKARFSLRIGFDCRFL
jgi:hypothetical protein